VRDSESDVEAGQGTIGKEGAIYSSPLCPRSVPQGNQVQDMA
jgi:hypothetical protein